jgi:hypothetical protein
VIWSSLHTKLGLAAVTSIIVLAGSVAAVNGYINERETRIKFEAEAATEAAVQKGLVQQISDLEKQMAARDAAYQGELQTLNSKFQSASTPTQIAQLLAQVMGLKQPVTITVPSATPQDPHPSAIAQVPEIDFPQAKAYVQDCELSKLSNTKCQADLADRIAQQALAERQIASLKDERDSWKVAAKGTRWQRIWNSPAVKVIIFAGGVYVGHKVK